jgi:hypothetical protein
MKQKSHWMGSYWERVTTLVCNIVETCSVIVKLYLICFESAHWVKMMIRLVRVLNCDDFVLKGVYHNGCMTKYMLKSSPKNEQKQDSDLSGNEIAFQNLIIVETCSVIVKLYLICFENTAVLFTCIFSIAITVVNNFNFTWYKIVHCGHFLQNTVRTHSVWFLFHLLK